MNEATTTTPTVDPSQPIGTPPGGGSWTWDASRGGWVSLDQTQQPGAADASNTPQE